MRQALRSRLPAALLGLAILLVAAGPATAAESGQRERGERQGQREQGQQQGQGDRGSGAREEKPAKPPTPAERLGIEARAWSVTDARSGETLLSHGLNQRLLIASTTKLMTAYVTLKEMPLDEVVRAAPYESSYGESLLGLRAGERISVKDLLYGLIMVSGNDAAHTLAIRTAGSTERFVRMMNRYAAALGLSNTRYANPIGLDEEGNYSTAADLTTLTRELMEIPVFAKIADAETVLLRSMRPPRRIEAINELLYMEPWVTGVKTGHTWGAGWVLVGSGRKKGVDLVSVALWAPTDETRYSDNMKLLEYGFSQYQRRRPVRDGEEMALATIRYSGGNLPLLAARGVKVGIRKGESIEVRVRAPAEVEGPIRRGAKLGKASVYVEGRLADSVPLRASRAIPAASAFDRARTFVADNLIPIAIAAFVILMGGVILWRRLSR